MPTLYEYVCPNCQRVEEHVIDSIAREPRFTCPKCSPKVVLTRKLSTPGTLKTRRD